MRLVLISLICFLVTTGSLWSRSKTKFNDIWKDLDTSIKDPFDLRDPFKRPPFPGTTTGWDGGRAGTKKYSMIKGVLSNVEDRINFTSIDVSKIKIVGIILGKNRRVMVRIKNRVKTFVEGMRFGKQGEIELKAILPGGVVFAEKIKNVYNQDEYIETIIPVNLK